jgi:nucleoside-diphosphate-sugar epimerase
MRVLVTGATGFVGWHAAARLIASGHEVRALVRNPEKAARHLGPLGLSKEQLVVGDMTDESAVNRALESCTAVIHAAASVSVTNTTGRDTFDGNVTGTRLVMGGAVERGIHAALFVSSLTAILDPSGPPATAASPLVESATRYGRSKADSDSFVRELEKEGAPVAIVYPSAVIGPDDPGLSESMRAFRNFLRSTLRSSGGAQFVDVRDLAELCVKMLEQQVRGRALAAGHFYDWDGLTNLLEEISGAKIQRIRAPGWLLRSAGSAADAVSRATGKSLMLTREALEIATRWKPVEDSPEVARLGTVWRDPRETIHDMLCWLLEAGRLPPRAAPRLAPQLEPET